MSNIAFNKKAHDAVASRYEKRHGEIFNDIEQGRLTEDLARAQGLIRSGGLKALDYGCGTGNLTGHLLKQGFSVTAADISENFLTMVKARFPDKQGLSTSVLNGQDLSQFADNSFDFVCTYSVLHHVPDYLSAIKEMIRVLKSGGVLYLDHENAPAFWELNADYQQFVSLNPQPFAWHKVLHPRSYLDKVRKIFQPRYQAEGDIHVWADDHIEWEKIEDVLKNSHCELVYQRDYLLFKKHYNREIYQKFQDHCADMRVFIARKLS